VKIVDISMPAFLIEKNHPHVYCVEAADARRMLPQRSPDAHKNQCGQAALIAGSRGLTGAAALAAEASLRAGAGLSYLVIPADLNAVLEAKLTEVITVPMHGNDGYLSTSSLPLILEQIANKTAVAVGPGLGRHQTTCELVRQLLQTVGKPLVLDADGLFACIDHTHLFREYKGELILTPHVGELSRLTGLSAEEIEAERIQIARRYAAEWRCTLVLKGGPTVTACADGRVFINSTGNAGMATAGAGDVLTGIIAGLTAQGLSAVDAAVAGVYVHGLAGDLAKKSLGELGMIAGDILRHLPYALRRLPKEKE
jgi:ADP-dependent NAD(P)H-hydrate dehydratase / NAD(P)H-hydrate epimerase